jgi:hypothetical protein
MSFATHPCVTTFNQMSHAITNGYLSQPHFGQSGKMQLPLPKVGDLESSGTPKNSENDLRGQISSHWCVLYVIEKISKCRFPKWPRMNHLDICSPSYGQKKGRESNWHFDSRPLKVGNRPLPDIRFKSVTWRWKALKESYNFALDLVAIGFRSREIWTLKVSGFQPETISGLQLGSPGKKNHLDVVSTVKRREYFMGEGGGFPRVWAVVNLVCSSAHGLSQHPRVFPNAN